MVGHKIVATADIEPSETLSEIHTIVATFHDFCNLPYAPINGSREGDCVESPGLQCHGYRWKVRLMTYATNSQVAIYLQRAKNEPNMSITRENVRTTFSIRVGRQTRTQKATFSSGTKLGWDNFLNRGEVLDPANGYLQANGSLKVEVDIQVFDDTPVVWTPRKRLRLDLLESLESGDEGDVCFKVGEKTFTVMKHWIARRAPTLGDMATSQPPGIVIPINNVDPEAFGVLLQFIYTDDTPESMDPRSVLEVADRFGCSPLKLIAEAEIVKAGVNEQNAVELLLFADAHSCALLREAAREFCVTHRKAMMECAAWQELKQSTDLLAELAVGMPSNFSDSDYNTMRVSTLRQKLEDKGLEVDGTRETLIRRLKDSIEQRS